MNNRTIAAINAAAAARSDDFEVEIAEDVVTVSTYTNIDFSDEFIEKGRYHDRTVEAHRLDNGRWILARWSDMHAQWQSSDFTARFVKYNRQAVYCFARKLEGLAGDIRTYPSAAAAIRAAFAE